MVFDDVVPSLTIEWKSVSLDDLLGLVHLFISDTAIAKIV
jgi:hypothetical protein